MKNWRKISYQEFNKNQRICKNNQLKSQFRVKLMLALRQKQEMMKKRKKRRRKRKKRRRKKKKKRRRKKRKRKKKKKLKRKKKNHQPHQLRNQMKRIHTWMLIWIQMNSILAWTTTNKKRKKHFQLHFQLKKWPKWSQMERIC